MAQIQKLQLYNFRNFESLSLNFLSGISLIIGPNGTGKTNLLEAISVLAPGRGLRGAPGHDICRIGAPSWNINALLDTKIGPANMSLSYDTLSKRKSLEFNGEKITLNELANFTSAIWLTPQMDGLFLGSASDRRRFLDRLVLASFSNHAELVSKYEKYQKERLHILENSLFDESWLNIIEKEMASLAIDTTQNRLKTIEVLNKHILEIDSTFPKAHLVLESSILPYLEEIELLYDKFKSMRSLDKETKKTHFGANKTDFLAYYGTERILAHYCSTGQQKSLLISILMAQQFSLAKTKISQPILLLDEIFVHLDDEKREALADFLCANKVQAFITSTEKDLKLLLQNPNIVDFHNTDLTCT